MGCRVVSNNLIITSSVIPTQEELLTLPDEVGGLLKRSPVDRLNLPLPTELETAVKKVLDFIRDRRSQP
jgi:hypothetical protein